MLVVDPVKRITIAEIRQLPWFKQNLPAYLRPLPPTPAAESPGFDFMMSRSADPSPEGSEGATPEPGDALSTPDLGHLEEEIVEELAGKMVGFTREDVVQHLMDPSDNQVKVAYQLVRDHKRMLQTAHLDEQKEMQGFLAQSPPAWNAGLSELGRSTSIKRQGRSAPPQPVDGNVTDEPDHSVILDGNATDDAAETSDDGGTLLSDEDATDDDLAESATPVHSGIGVLETSLLRGNVGELRAPLCRVNCG
jgi:carbon catabolite-derepressing protein kinase